MLCSNLHSIMACNLYTKMHLCGNALLCTIICIFIGNNLWTNSFSPSCFAWTPPWFREDFKNWIYAFESLHENHFPNYSNNNITSISYSVSYSVPTFSATCSLGSQTTVMVQRELSTLGTFLQIQTHSSGKAPVPIPPLKQTNKHPIKPIETI